MKTECDDAIGNYISSINSKNADFELCENALKKPTTILEESDYEPKDKIKVQLTFDVEKMKIYKSVEAIRYMMVSFIYI